MGFPYFGPSFKGVLAATTPNLKMLNPQLVSIEIFDLTGIHGSRGPMLIFQLLGEIETKFKGYPDVFWAHLSNGAMENTVRQNYN